MNPRNPSTPNGRPSKYIVSPSSDHNTLSRPPIAIPTRIPYCNSLCITLNGLASPSTNHLSLTPLNTSNGSSPSMQISSFLSSDGNAYSNINTRIQNCTPARIGVYVFGSLHLFVRVS